MSASAAEPAVDPLREIVQLACRAPSVHNTQPWSWRIAGHALELYADRSRQLPVADPEGRDLVISCGAALHHAQTAGLALGWQSSVTRYGGTGRADLLARITFSPATAPQDGLLRALTERRTDRRRFTAWPVPPSRLDHLARAAAGPGIRVVPLVEAPDRVRTELLVHRALGLQAGDPELLAEQAAWLDRWQGDGIPSSALRPADHTTRNRASRFTDGDPEFDDRVAQSTDGLLAVCTSGDDVLAWLRAGEALSALWLEATREGLSVVPISSVIEVDSTRDALFRTVLHEAVRPQVLVRVGWQELGRSELPRSPRRPIDDVLRP
jgi:nitroreductase